MATELIKPQTLKKKAKRPRKAPAKKHAAVLDAARVYEASAELLYGVVRNFLTEPLAGETIRNICRDLVTVIPDSGYQNYNKLACLHTAYLHLTSLERGSIRIDPALSSLTLDEAFTLVLRDSWQLTCAEIGAIMGTSEGSIRTRLARSRAKVFTVQIPSDSARPAAMHACIGAQELIEDWVPESDHADPPEPIEEAMASCTSCHTTLEQRKLSAAHFKRAATYSVPVELAKFPIQPMLGRTGPRVRFNWSAAPWYVKALIEGMVATTLVVGVVFFVPRVKNLYEFWLERRFDLYSVAELAIGLGGRTESAPAQTQHDAEQPGDAAAKTAQAATTPLAEAKHLEVSWKSEYVGRDGETLSADRLGRVLVKVDEPEAVKTQIEKLLTRVTWESADPETPAGAALPGGILFDIFVPQKQYKALVNEVGKLGDTQVVIGRSRERGKPGQSRLKIWLQRI